MAVPSVIRRIGLYRARTDLPAGRFAGIRKRGRGRWPRAAAPIRRRAQPMSGYTKTNLREVENSAPKFKMPSEMSARFARTPLGGETLGLSLFTARAELPHPVRAQARLARRRCTSSSAARRRIKVGDEIVEVGQWDAIRFDKDTMRNVEAGPDGDRVRRLRRRRGRRARSRWRRTGGATDQRRISATPAVAPSTTAIARDPASACRRRRWSRDSGMPQHTSSRREPCRWERGSCRALQGPGSRGSSRGRCAPGAAAPRRWPSQLRPMPWGSRCGAPHFLRRAPDGWPPRSRPVCSAQRDAVTEVSSSDKPR